MYISLLHGIFETVILSSEKLRYHSPDVVVLM